MLWTLGQFTTFDFKECSGRVIFANSHPQNNWVSVSFIFDKNSPSGYDTFLSLMSKVETDSPLTREVRTEEILPTSGFEVEIPKKVRIVQVRGSAWSESPYAISPKDADDILKELKKHTPEK